MEITNVLVQGVVLGFSIAAPVGPIAILLMRRTLNQGLFVGAVSGLGAATADALYGAIVGFGLASLHNALIKMQFFLSILGGAFLVFLGIKTLFAKPSNQAAEPASGNGVAGAFISTFLLTLSNPMTLLAFAAVVTALGLKTGVDYPTAVSFVTGVFIGSAGWYLLLTALVSQARTKMNESAFRIVNQISGIIILGFGIYILWSAGYILYMEINQAIAGAVGQAKRAMVGQAIFSRLMPF
jgi:threonine/homoserine/homoserine lactone efflux protein